MRASRGRTRVCEGGEGSSVRSTPTSPVRAPAGAPRSSNAKPHTLVPAFTRGSAYKTVTLETLAVTVGHVTRWHYKASSTANAVSSILAEIPRTLDGALSVARRDESSGWAFALAGSLLRNDCLTSFVPRARRAMRATCAPAPDRFGADRAHSPAEGRRHMPAAAAAADAAAPRARLLVAAGVAL